MANRTISFTNDEYYHVYNQGVDKRAIFESPTDTNRFIQSMVEFNTIDPIGSIYEKTYATKNTSANFGGSTSKKERLVEIICYCLNPNHFHLLIRQKKDSGITKFMHRLSTGYTMYFNEKLKRRGSLFQGRFKAKHITDNDYLLHVSTYVNLNNRVHRLGGSTSKNVIRSSWRFYEHGIYDPVLSGENSILDQFKNPKEYAGFALDNLPQMLEVKKEQKELKELLLED